MRKAAVITFIFLLVFILTACSSPSGAPSSGQPCAKCSDANGDGKCDACGNTVESIPDEPDVPDEPCTECKDADGDGKCDVCGEAVQSKPADESVVLIEDGEIKFSLVLSKNLSGAVNKKIDALVKKMKSLGYTLEKLDDTAATVTDCEVIIGQVSSRGSKYDIDPHYLGIEGYAVKIIDGKILILGGSDEMLLEAIDHFTEKGLKITDDTKKLTDAKFLPENEAEEIQKDYKISSITVSGKDIRNYVIAVDKSLSENTKAANAIREALYEYAGYWLNTVDLNEIKDENYIAIKTAEKSGGNGFSVRINGENLEITCEFPNRVVEECEMYFKQKLLLGRGELVLDEKEVNVRDISYIDFGGAAGDGETDDSEAIRKTHEYANRYGHTVVADYGTRYYIGPIQSSIIIQTDVKWNDAEIIIDDRSIASNDPLRSIQIFKVISDHPAKSFSASDSKITEINTNGGLPLSTSRIDLGLGYPALLKIVNSNHKNFIRHGANANSGHNQTELVLVDENGNISESTPIMFAYDEVTEIIAFRSDVKPITLDGGTFITRANQAHSDYSYYARNISISRSNTTVKNLTYRITDESEDRFGGDPYSAFISVENSNNVTLQDCSIAAHRTYYSMGSGGVEVGMGSYGIGATLSNNVTWLRCVQPNFFVPGTETPSTEYWGIMGTNFCKNLKMQDSVLTCFDAHSGVYNADIINSKVVHIEICGGGKLKIENSDVYKYRILGLKDDYGAFWHGDITIKDVTVHYTGSITVIGTSWYHHDFGYSTALPRRIIIDGLKLTDPNVIELFSTGFVKKTNDIIKEKLPAPELDENGNPTGNEIEVNNLNPTKPTEEVIIRNNTDGYTFNIPDKEIYPFFKDMKITVE